MTLKSNAPGRGHGEGAQNGKALGDGNYSDNRIARMQQRFAIALFDCDGQPAERLSDWIGSEAKARRLLHWFRREHPAAAILEHLIIVRVHSEGSPCRAA